MNDSHTLDEQLVQRLPLPLAQLCRRSQNAKTPLERHLTAYYLWEAALKLLGGAAVVEYAELKEHDAETTEKLKNLARPSLGHWWELVRRLVPILADHGDKGFVTVRDLVLGRARDDLPRAAGLYNALTEALEGRGGTRGSVRLTELFDRLVNYRNRELGHGAAGQRPGEFYRRMGGTLFSGLVELLGRIDVVAGRRLVYVGEVRRLATGDWSLDRYALVGDALHRLEPLQLPSAESAWLPRPECVYLEGRVNPAVSVPFPTLRALTPLVHCDADAGKLFFLNSRRGKKQIEYLCYSTGEVLSRDSAGEEQRQLLARVLDIPVDGGAAEEWVARILAEEPPAPEAAGAVRSVGEFELLSRLGQGGMGVVYRAWQPSLGRQVALKCMLRTGDPRAEARFAREIRALGRIEHPNVVKVFTSGVDGDQWFYVMELIEGAELSSVCEQLGGSDATEVDEGRWQQALSRACEQSRSRETPVSKSQAPSTPAPSTPPPGEQGAPAAPPPGVRAVPARRGRGHVRQVVEIIRQVAGAVHALHEAGVIHRDIKPNNIMLTADGAHPVLMDLGLAQLADEADGRLTRTRQFVGTLRYASPEQVLAAGKVDRRTDIYSLGVTLWELLTLRPAHGANDEMPTPELMLRIQTADLEGPRKYNRHVPRDLEAIVRKCLEKDRARRYATAGDLADDLGRFLKGEPVAAQPPSFRYLAGKFVRRYRVPLGVAALVLLLLGVGTLVAFLRISAERNEAIAARNREEVEKQNVQNALNDLRRSRREAEVVWKVVEQAYTSVKEDNLRHLQGLSPVHEELARIRLEGMQQLARATPDDPAVEPKVARAHAMLGMIGSYVGSVARARENLEKAAELYAQLAKKYPDNLEYRLHECRALYQLAWLLWDDNRKAAARGWVEQALRRLEKEYARSPDDPEVCFELGRCLTLLGGCLPGDAPRETREKLATRACGLFERLIGQKYREADSRNGLAVATYRLTYARFNGFDQQGLLTSLERVAAEDDRALKLLPESPHLQSMAVFMHWDRAEALLRLGRVNDALAEHQAAVAKARAVVKGSPDIFRYTDLLADSLNRLGWGYRRLRRAADARATYEESNRILDNAVRAHPDRAVAANEWLRLGDGMIEFLQYGPYVNGEIQARQERLRLLDEAVRRGRELAAHFPDHHWLQVNFAKALADRGRYDTDAKRPAQALPFLLEAAEVYRTRLLDSKDAPAADTITTYVNHLQLAATCAADAGKGDEVIRLGELAWQVRQQCSTRASADDLGTVLVRAAKAHRDAGRPAEAIQTLRQAIEVRRPAFDQATWHYYLRNGLGDSYRELADLYHQLRDFRNEVLANREYLKLIVGPLHGAKIDDYTDSARPGDEAEANRIRDLIRKATASGIKRFTIPCDFNGITYPIHFYVTNVPWPTPPLEDQVRWLREERNGVVPPDALASFNRMHKVAHENNVSFVELCLYALAAPSAEGAGDSEIDGGDEGTPVAGIPQAPGKAAVDPLAEAKTRLAELKTRLDNDPDDVAKAREAAKLYDDLGGQLLKARQPAAAVEMLREAARLRESLVRREPGAAEPRQLLAASLLSLGKAQARVNDYPAAEASWHRRLDVLEQLQLEAPSAALRLAVADTRLLFGELAQRRGDGSEALRWYVRAMPPKSEQAGRKIAGLLSLNASIAELLPADLRAIYNRMVNEGRPGNPLTFVADFAREVEAVQKAKEGVAAMTGGLGLDAAAALAWITDLAESHRAAAVECLKQGKKEESLGAYRREVELRLLLSRVTGEQRWTDDYGRAMLDAAKVSLDLGKTAEGIKLLETAQRLNDENATFFLAEVYEQGKGVPKDVKKAVELRSTFTYEKGSRLAGQKKYAEAVVEFERSIKEKPSIDGYRQIGFCQRKLGRETEALAAFRKGIDLAQTQSAGLGGCYALVLDLADTALSVGKPEEVLALFRLLEERKWTPDGTPVPYTLEREFAGLRAIALQMAGKDAGEAQKKLEEIVARPNLVSSRVRTLDLQNWLKTPGLPEDRKAAVQKAVALLGVPVKRLEEPYYPLNPGRTWFYKASRGGRVKVRVARVDRVGEREYLLLETEVDSKVTASERLVVEPDGVYRQLAAAPLLQPHLRLLPLPARDGTSWTAKSKTDRGDEMSAEGRTRVEDVTVPAGTYKGAVVAEMKIHDAAGERVETVWYAREVGPVKRVVKTSQATVVWELEKVDKQALTSLFEFEKSGKLKGPTPEELRQADESTAILCYVHMTTSDGKPFWVYMAIKPSKYAEFHRLTTARQPLILDEYGATLKKGWGKEIPDSVKEEMKRDYGFDEHFAEKLREQAIIQQAAFLEREEAKRIAEIVALLKKKQGR